MPFFAGKCRSKSIVASNPPADPPMPTIGQAIDLLAAPLSCARRALGIVIARRRTPGVFVLALEGTRSQQCLTFIDFYRQILAKESETKNGWKLLNLGERKMNEHAFGMTERRKAGSSWVNILLGIWVRSSAGEWANQARVGLTCSSGSGW
jgi:hypothetical protein